MIQPSQATTSIPSPDAVVCTTTLIGLEADHVRVEVSLSQGARGLRFVGPLSEMAERETRVRILAALASVGIARVERTVVINIVGKSGLVNPATADLAIALAVLGALGDVPEAALDNVVVLGELSLSGDLRPIRGALAHVLGAKAFGHSRAILPFANGLEASGASGITVHLATTLREIVAYLNGEHDLPIASTSVPPPDAEESLRFDFADIRGLGPARRALEIAAAGNHNLLLVGPVGSGKTMLARRLTTILPPLTKEEAITVTMIHSVAGLLPANARIASSRPFRAPHHTVSDVGLLGGGTPIRPGELSLAHQGVLYLDDIQEFRKSTLDALPAILERGDVQLSRGGVRGTFPAQPLIVASALLCQRGHYVERTCDCTPERLTAYRARLAALTLRMFDLRATVMGVGGPDPESSATIRQRVLTARAARAERASGRFDTVSASLDAPSAKLIADAAARLVLSGAEYSKILRVARTIADLDGSVPITSVHMDEAIATSIVSPFAR